MTTTEGGNRNQDGFPPALNFPPDVPPQHQTLVASLLVACMIGSVITISVVLRTLRLRGYFGSVAVESGNYESSLTSSRPMDTAGGRFISLTERRRREELLMKSPPSVISLPIKSLHQNEPMVWGKLQPVCAQFDGTDGRCTPHEFTKDSTSLSNFDTDPPVYGGVMVGTIIMMPSATERCESDQKSIVKLEMMLGTSRVREI